MQSFDVQTIRRTVGAAAYARGLQYFNQGAVLSASPVAKPGQPPKLVGTVQGTDRYPYSVIVTSASGGRSSPGLVSGVCTCPMGNNCKHVAAVMLASDDGSMSHDQPTRASWEDALNIRPSESHRNATAAVEPIALLIEPKHNKYGQLTLPMRPVRWGEHNRWVRSGISWNEVTEAYAHHWFPTAPVALLKEVSTLHGPERRFYYYGNGAATIELTAFPSGRIWDVLADAAAAQLPLVSSADGMPVALSTGPAHMTLDLADSDGSWAVTPMLTVNGESISGTVTLLGDPAHGLAWWADAVDPGSSTLHLARLAQPLAVETHRLLTTQQQVVIPVADQGYFLRNYLPSLRSQLEVTSRDGSVTIPAPQSCRLALIVTHDADHRIGLTWRRRYAVGDEVVDISITDDIRLELRDGDVEQSAEAAAAATVEPLAALRFRGPFGLELTPHAELAGSDALRFDRDVLPVLQELAEVDVEIAEGAGTFREASSAPVVTLSGSAESGTDWFDLTVSVTMEGEAVPFAALFQALVADEKFLILPSGTYFQLDRPELQQLRTLIEESRALTDTDGDTLHISRFQASFWAELEQLGVLDEQAADWGRTVRDLARCDEIPEPELPAGLHATLRPYQRQGYTWLAFLYDSGLGGVLADDMGLGKTVQALAMICRARDDKPGGAPFLVVAPTSVVGNWAAESHRFAPELKTASITETESRRGVPLEEVCAGLDIVITSYALFRLEYDEYEGIGWSGLLLDEAQAIKNHQSKGYQCARKLPAPFKVVITGTPMENNLMELWAMFSIAAPGLLSDPRRFAEYYQTPIEKNRNAERLDQLRRRIRPLLMRRTKQQVVTDLPAKTEQVIQLDLVPQHRRVYQRYLQRERQKVLGLLGDMNRHRFQIFRSLTLLRQAALDVSLVDSKHAKVPVTKLDALMDIVRDVSAEGHRVLIFSQFTRFLSSARSRLDRAGIDHCYLDGKTRNRGAVLSDFKQGSAPVFLISLKAGGVGLNLTEADYCILLDPWWNPATEQQAVDRTHRIGQDKPVMVYRLVAKDTIEEKVMALKARKAALFDSILSDGGIGTGGLTAKDVRALLE